MSSQPVRFAVIGCGALAQSTHLPNLAGSTKASLVLCCDTSEPILDLCRDCFKPQRVTTDWHQAVTDPQVDAICLATTEKLRLPVIEAAAAAGKPVYVEKPLARELDEVYAIADVVKRYETAFCVGHNRRSSPAMIDAHRIFRNHMTTTQPCPWRWERERDGRPELAEESVASINIAINDDWFSWKSWVFDPQHAPYGPMLFEMTHFTDLCNWFLDAEPVEVFAMQSGMLIHAITVRYAGGELATLHMAANGTFGYPKERYELMGRGGIVVVDHMIEVHTAGIADASARTTYPIINDRYPHLGEEGGLYGYLAKQQQAYRDAEAHGDPRLTLHGGPDKGHAHQLNRFIDQITGTGPQVCGIDAAVKATRVAFAAILAATEHRIVSLNEV